MSKQAIRDRVMGAKDIRTETVEVPEWDCTGTNALTVRALSGAQRDEFEKSCMVRAGKRTDFNISNMRAKLVAMCIVDESGERVFSEEDAKWLGQKSAAALQRVYDVAARLSRITEEDAEELLKNSVSGPSVDSISDSPSLSAAL